MASDTNGILYAGTSPSDDSGKVYRSTDNGGNWTALAPLSSQGLGIITSIIVKPNNYILVRTDSKVYRSSDNGNTWNSIHSFTGSIISIVSCPNGYLYDAEYADSTSLVSVCRSTDDGITWTKVSTLSKYSNASSTTVLVADFKNYIYSYNEYGSQTIWRSTDDGTTWHSLERGWLQTTSIFSMSAASDIVFAFSFSNSGFYKSTDNGNNWAAVSNKQCSLAHTISSIKINSKGMLLGVNVIGGVIRSTDHGNSWENICSDTISHSLTWIGSDNVISSDDCIYFGTQAGIYKSVNTTTINPTSVKEGAMLPSGFSLSQNYPNPFNPSTVIKYSLSSTSHVRLIVFNSLGQAVKELVNENKNAGNYEIQFDGSKLSSGVYFYTMTANDFSSTRKSLLLK